MSDEHDDAAAPNGGDRRVLLIAFHFPPDASSTGRLRTLAFARHLRGCHWNPWVLAPHPRVYERLDTQGLEDIPADVHVERSQALDARRHLGWRGRYLSATAIPDRWISWYPSALRAGLRLIRRQRIDALWSTYPISTTHLVGASLARLSGLPWIADFRDPVVPAGTSAQKRATRAMERWTIERADRIVFTTPGARSRYAERFPDAASRMHVIPNGFEGETVATVPSPSRGAGGPVRLVHSGLLYREGRNPVPFFEALARLREASVITPDTLEVVLRASGHEAAYAEELTRLGIDDIVTLAPPVGYREALAEQAGAHGLLLFQGGEFNAQIPAKVFEYLRIGRPVIALTPTDSDTAELLRTTGGALRAPIDDVDKIAAVLRDFMIRLDGDDMPAIDVEALSGYTRKAGAMKLARLLDELTGTER
ncbi:glycosyltransferase [Salinisphaera orenii]|uniref:Glycosyltransferase subfamily 4-like N-terminal domain-containing protein n=1 Tax=Salinisphaera orenii YIM 95161 TaxID=1051139 RepID=A0A423Q3F2_9GAMM|nr:glycosyltransferase [Salinisphaera halophila]ROO33063.1 hypothetical protein SAHL_04085 [Salinisphaera halophila YIM 95161]